MEVKYITTEEELGAARDEILAASDLGCDLETSGFDAHKERLMLMQWAPTPDKGFVFDIHKLKDPNLFSWVKDLLADPNRCVMFQNGKFDMQFLTDFFGEGYLPVENLYDTMLASKILARGDERLRHGLGDIAYRETQTFLDKTLQKSDFGSANHSEAQLLYAARDAGILHSIRAKQGAKLEGLGLDGVARLENDAVAMMADVEYQGIYLDADEWSIRVQRQGGAAHELELQIHEIIAPHCPIIDLFDTPVINLDSPKDILPIFKKMGIPVEATNEDELSPYRGTYPIIDLFLNYKQNATGVSKFGPKYLLFINPLTGRIHCSFNQMRAPSGRMSCSKPNLQQVPHEKEYRQCFKAQYGGKLITADYGQIELRIMAMQSQDPVLMQAYINGEDLHDVTSVKVLGEPPDNINPERRRLAKNLNFGTTYGAGAENFAQQAGVLVPVAEKLLKDFWDVYKVLDRHMKRQGLLAADQGVMKTASGRTVLVNVNPDDRAAYGAAKRLGRNFAVQGTGADILKRALYLLRNDIISAGLKRTFAINMVHDEIVVETNDDEHLVAAILESAMMEAGEEYLHGIPCKVDVKIGDAWSK